MVYVKHFDILGIETAQIPCVELQGPPTSATEGAVGLLGMDVTAEDKVVYICTAVNGAIYTWKSLKDGKDGVCVVKSEINGNGELVLTLSNGNTLNAGVVKGADGKDGSNGKNGTNGVGVSNAQINDKGELIITLSNGNTKNAGVVVGAKGESGVSVVQAEINASYELTLTLSNGTVMNLGSIKSDYATKANSLIVNNLVYNKGDSVGQCYYPGDSSLTEYGYKDIKPNYGNYFQPGRYNLKCKLWFVPYGSGVTDSTSATVTFQMKVERTSSSVVDIYIDPITTNPNDTYPPTYSINYEGVWDGKGTLLRIHGVDWEHSASTIKKAHFMTIQEIYQVEEW